MFRTSLALTACLFLTHLAWADAPASSRGPAKEPGYRSATPRYGLLLFGPEGKHRVWLVQDGDTLYVDRRGDGDLTLPGNKVVADKREGRDPEEEGYTFTVGEVRVGDRVHKGLVVYVVPLKAQASTALGKRRDVQAALAKDPKATAMRLSVDIEMPGLKGGGIDGRVNFLVGPVDLLGVLQLGEKPRDAPNIHLGGPLQITFESELPTLRVGRGSEFFLVVGTPGGGPGTFAMLNYEETVPPNAQPVAEATMPSSQRGAPAVVENWVIESRC
jgi:hypothetical protein